MYKSKFFKGKKLRRILSLALVVSTLITATACGSNVNGSSPTTGSGDNTLTISVITKDMYLDTAVKLFQEQHPGVTINVEEYTSEPIPKSEGKGMVVKGMEKAEDIEKYKNAVNTQLMSGRGPDIMLLSPLPFENYIDKNMLVNLSDMVQSDKSFDIGKYYTNILDAMKYNGSLYGLPTSVQLSVLQANKSLLDKYSINIEDDKWTWDDFGKTAETIINNSGKDGIQDMYALSGMDGSTLVSSLVSRSFNEFVDKNAKTAGFDTEEFIDILNLAKGMIDKDYINTDTTRDKMMDLASRGNTAFSVSNIRNYMDMMMAKQIYSDGVEFLKYPGEGQDQSFTVNNLYGINDKSPNKALAWEFLKFLVSEEMMSQPSLVGLPVNKAAAEIAAQNAVKMSEDIISGKGKIAMNNNGQTIVLNKLITKEDVNIVNDLINKANKYNKIDQQVLTILNEETRAFFDGQKTADDTAKTIQDRVYTYINE